MGVCLMGYDLNLLHDTHEQLGDMPRFGEARVNFGTRLKLSSIY